MTLGNNCIIVCYEYSIKVAWAALKCASKRHLAYAIGSLRVDKPVLMVFLKRGTPKIVANYDYAIAETPKFIERFAVLNCSKL
jgi:hypothetical protein